jgi:hypothetical protein
MLCCALQNKEPIPCIRECRLMWRRLSSLRSADWKVRPTVGLFILFICGVVPRDAGLPGIRRFLKATRYGDRVETE